MCFCKGTESSNLSVSATYPPKTVEYLLSSRHLTHETTMQIALFLLSACLVPDAVTPTSSVVEAPAPAAAMHKFTFVNRCEQDIWVGSHGQKGTAAINGGGWFMPARVKGVDPTPMTFEVAVGNSGRLWPRTECTFPGDGQNHCATGGCVDDTNKFALKCAQGGVPPVALLEWTLDAHSGNGPIDYYDGSLVDGWAVPLQMIAVANSYNPVADPGMDQDRWCAPGGCAVSPTCPAEYWDGKNCWSPCAAATRPTNPVDAADALSLCCSCSLSDGNNTCPEAECAGGYGCTPNHDPMYPADMVCDPTGEKNGGRAWNATAQSYIANVRAACPSIYAWQFDDAKGTFNCRKTDGLVDYVIEFCPGVPAVE